MKDLEITTMDNKQAITAPALPKNTNRITKSFASSAPPLKEEKVLTDTRYCYLNIDEKII